MIPPDTAQEMVQLCRDIPKHPSKMLKRLAPKDAPLYRTLSKNGHQHAVKSQLVREGRDPREDRLRQLVKGCGISFSHLTLNGPNMVAAKHTEGKNAGEFSHVYAVIFFSKGHHYDTSCR